MNGHANGTVHDLPKGDAATLTLVQPTREEKLVQWTKNAASWKGALSLEAYLRREDYLAGQDFTRDGGITWWALVDSASEKRRVLAGCESFRKKAVVAQNGKITESICHGVGSVFCPPEYRGRGYAQRMMRELAKELRTWQAEETECLFTVLWSDIGKQFYANYGWEPFNSGHISIPASTDEPSSSLPASRALHARDLADLCAADEALLRKNLREASTKGKTQVAILPDVQTIRWHHAREEFVGKEFYGDVPVVKGAIVGDKPGKRVWCYWTRMWYNTDPRESKDNTLHILRLVIEENVDSDDVVPAIASILAAARNEAQRWHMAEVEAWNPSADTVEAARLLHGNAQVITRDKESISSMLWYGEKGDGGSIVDAIDWVGNEKYGWC
ncbi:hypothetical protein K490DRAFT_54182 [Saccharata proteae CBS 121410]|uniref:LYC1 C-terminal domain-containing protein n=1 Tax=Saccharata proteae CBS 121410 TaxID=1314787 RepID=A0A9P4I0M1_9PEZI|nr:hypothetical protein K490DRAFT_54182 [Saccharata proteae CBS 121410]